MVRRIRRLVVIMASGITAGVLSLGLTTPASATTSTPPPAGVDITGAGIAEPLHLRADTQPNKLAAVIDQVNFLGGAGQSSEPKKADLGPKYTIVVLSGDKPTQTFDLYPKATGGPRIYRPAKQPDSQQTTAGWFFGRLTMSETLRTAGVPLERQVDTVGGGAGGSERMIPEDSLDPAGNIDEAFSGFPRLLLVNVAVVLTITLGLAGIALLIRRRTR